LFRTTLCRLQVDELVIRLCPTRATRQDGFDVEILIPLVGPIEFPREYQLCKTGRGEVFLWMQQDGLILELSNSVELIGILTTDPQVN
jgi:hypothetical protein